MLSQLCGVYREFLSLKKNSTSHICRETSNKALNAINEIHLVPFLMSFLAARDKLPLATVTAAGVFLGIRFTSPFSRSWFSAQCLYVLTDDNHPSITDVRTDGSYISCLLSIARQEDTGSPEKKDDPKSVTLAVLAAGMFCTKFESTFYQ